MYQERQRRGRDRYPDRHRRDGRVGHGKIGVLQPLSGAVKYYGQSATWAFYSGFAYKAGGASPVDATPGSQTVTVGDMDYELIMRDTQASPDVAQKAATELVENDEVDMLWGMDTAPAYGSSRPSRNRRTSSRYWARCRTRRSPRTPSTAAT